MRLQPAARGASFVNCVYAELSLSRCALTQGVVSYVHAHL
jgi:hypothetical protein